MNDCARGSVKRHFSVVRVNLSKLTTEDVTFTNSMEKYKEIT